jgi:hypothetical protein
VLGLTHIPLYLFLFVPRDFNDGVINQFFFLIWYLFLIQYLYVWCDFHSAFLHLVWWFDFHHVLCLIEASHSFTARKYSHFYFIIQSGVIKILSTVNVTWALLQMKPFSATNMESVFPCSSTYFISFNSVTVPTWRFWVDLICSDSISQHMSKLSLELMTRLFWKSLNLCKECGLSYICSSYVISLNNCMWQPEFACKKMWALWFWLLIPVHETPTLR